MKTRKVLFSLCLTVVILQACGPSPTELTATAEMAAEQTQTAAPTRTPRPTPLPTKTPKPTSTVPGQSCHFVSITPVANASWPAFDFKAEGFDPGEGRFITLMADVNINGTINKVLTVQAGFSGESADAQGIIEGTIALTEVSGQNISPSAELELKIVGLASDCEAVQTVAWPGQ